MGNTGEKHAVNVIEEAGKKYYSSFRDMPLSLRKKISAQMLDNIFKIMVVPAIGEVRKLDRVLIHQCREIGEEGWIDCGKDWFDYCTKSVNHDTRMI